jgi:WD40 repeat protein
MSRRSSLFVIATLFLLVACHPASLDKTTAPATGTPVASLTAVPATETSTAIPVTETSEPSPELTTDWLSSLEVIRSGNWERLQLVKTFPAEMPLHHSAVAISLDAKKMAVGSNSRAQIHFFDLLSGQMSQSFFIGGVSDVDSPFEQIEYLPDGTLVANTDSPYMIYHIDAAGNVLSAWPGLGFALSADKTVMAHDVEGGTALVEIASNTSQVSLEGASAMAFAFSPDDSKLAVEDIGVDYIRTAIWDIPNKTLLTSLEETVNPRFSPDGNYLAVTKYDHENNKTPLKIFNPNGAMEIATLTASEPNDLYNYPALWSVDGSVVAAQMVNGLPIAWEAQSWKPLNAPALQGELYSFSPDGGILLWGVVL